MKSHTIAAQHKSDQPPLLIEKLKVLQLIQEQIDERQAQAKRVLNQGLIELDYSFLDELGEPSPSRDSQVYQDMALIIAELKSLYNKITKL